MFKLLFVVLIAGCGEVSDTSTDKDLGTFQPSNSYSQDVPSVSNGGSSNVPCQYANCNGPLNKQVEFSNPAKR